MANMRESSTAAAFTETSTDPSRLQPLVRPVVRGPAELDELARGHAVGLVVPSAWLG